MSPLERRYRRLLRWYPPDYRAHRGDEFVATLLDLAPPGRHRPTVAEAADLVAGGLRCRLGLATTDGLDEGLTRAAPVALALLGGISAFLWWRVEPLGPPTLGPVAYAAWLLACAVALLWPARSARPALGTALAVTAALPAVAPLTAYARPPLWVLMALAVFGLIALAGADPGASGERRAAPALGAVAALCAADLVSRLWTGPLVGYYQPAIAQVGVVVAGAVAAPAGLALAAARRGAPARAWLWAALLIGLPGAWLGPLDAVTWRATGELPPFGRLAQVSLGTCVVLIAMARLRAAGRGPQPPHATGPQPLRIAARPSPGHGEPDGRPAGPSPRAGRRPAGQRGVAGAVLLGYALGLLLFSGALGAVTGHAAATAGVCAAAAALLGLPDLRRAVPRIATSAAGTLLAAYAVGVYSNEWTAAGWTELARTAGLAATLAVLPLAYAAHSAWRVWRAPATGTARAGDPATGTARAGDPATGASRAGDPATSAAWATDVGARPDRRPSTLVAGVLCAGWLAWLTLPDLPAWGPVPLVLLAVPAVRAALAIPSWRARTGP